MKYFDMYIALIFAIKIGFILLALTHLYYKTKGEEESKNNKTVVYWKDRLEFAFVFLMSLLLIYLFNPRNNRLNMIDNEAKILLFLFGFILILTAKWNVFFEESKWLSTLQQIVGKKNN